MSDEPRIHDYVWGFVIEDDDGDGFVGVGAVGMGVVPLVTLRPSLLPMMRQLAQSHANQSGYRVTLQRFKFDQTMEVFDPD